jgi:hypothetical protein
MTVIGCAFVNQAPKENVFQAQRPARTVHGAIVGGSVRIAEWFVKIGRLNHSPALRLSVSKSANFQLFGRVSPVYSMFGFSRRLSMFN